MKKIKEEKREWGEYPIIKERWQGHIPPKYRKFVGRMPLEAKIHLYGPDYAAWAYSKILKIFRH